MPDSEPGQLGFGEFPWPSADDDLFDTSGSWTDQAVLDWRRDTIIGRMEGFRQAAEVLYGHAVQHRGDLDFLIYPLANCWRHHIELQLKTLLVALYNLLDELVSPPRGHDVLKLWRKVRSKLASAFPNESEEDVKNVERLLRQLHTADPDGQNFRYHRRANGELALTGVERIDIRAWHDGLEKVSNFLSGAHEQVLYSQDVKDGERDGSWL